MSKRLFEVTPDKEIVWEHVLTDDAQRVYQYAYDYCELTSDLGTQSEKEVTPPEILRNEPR
ncbi:MAG: hypothetical protein OCD02_07345 [Spirochaetaceae bacterium]